MANIAKNSGTNDKKKKIFAQGHHGLHTLHQQDRLPMADDSQGLPAIQPCVLLLYEVEARGGLRGHHGHAAREASHRARQGGKPKRRHHRLEECQDIAACGQGARHRWQQEDKREERPGCG